MATYSGQTTVTAAGTAVRLASDLPINAPLLVKALDTNTDLVAIGNVEEDVSTGNGLRLAAGESVIFEFVSNLRQIWVDAAVNGEGVAWLVLSL